LKDYLSYDKIMANLESDSKFVKTVSKGGSLDLKAARRRQNGG
jgi:hypothetical protein